ncbi:MAG TPA: restriction endonuclease subunit S [Anaerolineaceae bacterium]|nr:restriction endonuclease subunit S [Anaerolineaceae bacterium]
MKWQLLPFEELYLIPSRNGINRPSRMRGNGYKMINMGELFAYGRIRNPDMELVPLNSREIEEFGVETGDLLFARQSLIASGAGKCSIVVEVPEITVFEGHLIRVRLDQTKADPLFYYYFFSSHEGNGSIQSLVMQVAAAGIRGSELAKLPVPLPPIDIQRRIASILSAYDDLIENNNRRIALQEESMRLLYREWFVRLRFPGHEHVRVVDGLPEGWEMKPLEEICDLTMGQSPPSDTYNINGDGLPFHQGVTRFGDRFISHEIYCTSPNRVAEPGDILFSVRAPVGRINITLDKIIIGRGLSAIRSKTGNQSFLYYQLKEHFFKEDLLGSGAIFASVTKKELSNELLLNPKNEIIAAFEEISKPIDQQITNLNMQNIRLSEARDLLLPRLMSGQIDV